MLHPGEWEPTIDGTVERDLAELLESWIGHDKPITILDLSGIPSVVMTRLIGGILNIIYEGLFWGRELPEGGRKRPELIVMEEAHRYLGKEDDSPARDMVQRIVKEGRKFGVGAMIVSQRPSEIDDTILSQCGTFFALRLTNANDRSRVQAALPDNLSGVVDSLPVLRTGEAIIIGEAARLPIRCRVTLPGEEHRPQSGDPLVAAAWSAAVKLVTIRRLPLHGVLKILDGSPNRKRAVSMEREPVSSSSLVSVGYNPDSETLEVEFKNSGVYEY